MERNKRQILTEYLVHEAQQGNRSAFRQLYELWNPELGRYTAVRVQNSDAVSDVLQEVWIQITKGLKRLNDPACFPKWAFQIVSGKTADWIRKEQRNRKNKETFKSQTPLSASIVESPQIKQEQGDDLKVALSQLPNQQREILHLFYLSGLGISEIAQILSVPAGTIKSRLFKARENLKQVMTREKSEINHSHQ